MYAIPTLFGTKSIAMRNRHGVHQLAVPRCVAFVKGFQPVGKRSHFLSKYDYKFVAADPVDLAMSFKSFPHTICSCAQEFISGRMAERIICPF